MAQLKVDQKSMREVLSNQQIKGYLIPDYQRPYDWGEDQCSELWDDLIAFSHTPIEHGRKKFVSGDIYFLGSIVSFLNDEGFSEVIDGQQRLISFTLLLRAFVEYLSNEGSTVPDAADLVNMLNRCIWQCDDMDRPLVGKTPKIYSRVATDDDQTEFLAILKTGNADGMNSKYAINYRYFQNYIKAYIADMDTDNDIPVSELILGWLKHIIVMPIEADNRDSALQIFSTLNDRGLSLSDSDIFKSKLYAYYREHGQQARDAFIRNWQLMTEMCNTAFTNTRITSPLNEVFTQYSYWLRASTCGLTATTIKLRTVYEENNYAILRQDATMRNLMRIATFWQDIVQDSSRLPQQTRKWLYVLNTNSNRAWTYTLTAYYLNQYPNGLDTSTNLHIANHEQFDMFVRKLMLCTIAQSINNGKLSALRYVMIRITQSIVDGHDPFEHIDYNETELNDRFDAFAFTNAKRPTRSILSWWAFRNSKQPSPSYCQEYDIEHIYPRRRAQNDPLFDISMLESLGNKSLLEKSVNIRASDYRFEDKRKHYLNETKFLELNALGHQSSFDTDDIVKRYDLIKRTFISELMQTNLIR